MDITENYQKLIGSYLLVYYSNSTNASDYIPTATSVLNTQVNYHDAKASVVFLLGFYKKLTKLIQLNNIHDLTFINIWGKECKIYVTDDRIYSPHITASNSTSNSYFETNVVVGTGSTQLSENDTTLTNIKVVTTINNILYGYNDVGDPYIEYNITVDNKLLSDPITEIGLIWGSYSYLIGNSNTYTYCDILLDRTLLDTPLTLETGDIGNIVYCVTNTFWREAGLTNTIQTAAAIIAE